MPGTLRVFPIPGFGALQLGEHRFCHDENGTQDRGVFEFVHLWHHQDGRWRLARVVSYAH